MIRPESLLQKGCETRPIDVYSPADAWVSPRTMPCSDFPYHATGLMTAAVTLPVAAAVSCRGADGKGSGEEMSLEAL